MENKKANHMATNIGKPYPYVFKYVNCKGDNQADSYSCSYWRNYFNKDWHSRKQQKLF